MSDAVKSKRTYASPRRKQQAAETGSAILRAARELFVDQGWKATTIAAIAAKAGVATETVYAKFGTKRAILQAMVVAAMRGASPDTPFMEQSDRKAVTSQVDPEQMIEAFATDISAVLVRVAPVLAVVRTAATEDAEIKALYLDLHAARRRNLQSFVEQLKKVSGSRMRVSVDAATEHVWSVASPELYLLWNETASADSRPHREWLAETIKVYVLRS
jgi:AcrR family transcriptional regulator